MKMIILAWLILTLISVILGAPAIVVTPTTNTPTPQGDCNKDLCAAFGVGFKQGSFRFDNEPERYYVCYGDQVNCFRCPAGLFYSQKCDKCLKEIDDNNNVCTTTPTYDPPVTSPACTREEARIFCATYTGSFKRVRDDLTPTRFFTCDGYATCEYCPSGLWFSNIRQCCDYRQNVEPEI